MPLSDLYLMSEKEISMLYKDLAENFYHDDLYCTVFPDDSTRLDTLRHFFKHYVRAIRPYCHFVANSEEIQSVMVIWDSQLEQSLPYHIRLIRMNIDMIPMLLKLRSWNGILHVLRCLDMFTSQWVKEFVTDSYFHLDFFFTRPEARNQGIGYYMLKKLIEEARQQHREITMETHHDENLRLYNKVGFVLMSEVSHSQHGVRQYNLLMKND